MEYFLIFKYIVIFLYVAGIIILFFTISSIFALVKTKVPFAETPIKNVKEIFAESSLPQGSSVFDLGCGDGRVLFAAEELGYKAVGYELSLYLYLKCLIKKIIRRSSIKIYRKDFFKEDLSLADMVFIFLVDKVMEKTGNKLKKELKLNVTVVSYGFELPGWEIKKVLNTIPSKTYIYQT